MNDKPTAPLSEGITVDTVAGPMLIEWGGVLAYFDLVYPTVPVVPPRRAWWRRALRREAR